jgi:hypothetical protein
MPRPRSDKDGQVTIALPMAWLEEASQLAVEWGKRKGVLPGLTATRADVLRAAIRQGLDGLGRKKGGL